MRRVTVALATWAALVSAALPVQAQERERTLVMPFENVTRDRSIVWLGEASSVLLADYLNALGVNAIRREERREAFDRLQVPPAAVLSDATVIRIGELVGAAEVIVGTLEMAESQLVVHARTIALEPGRIRSVAVERGALADLFDVFERVAN